MFYSVFNVHFLFIYPERLLSSRIQLFNLHPYGVVVGQSLPRNVVQLLWEKAKDFLHRAFTIILLATIIIWFLQTFDLRLNVVTDSQNSILAAVAGLLAPPL